MSTLIMIDGGNVFSSEEDFHTYLHTVDIDPFKEKSRKWKSWLADQLTIPYIQPDMPNDWNAKYEEWRIWFERYLDFVEGNLILIGHSLGGSFLLRYLSEHPLEVSHLFLVAPAISDDGLGEESLGQFTPNLKKVSEIRCDTIHLFASTDDFVVPYSQSEELQKYMNCIFHKFTDRGHFLQETFPELLEEIKKYL